MPTEPHADTILPGGSLVPNGYTGAGTSNPTTPPVPDATMDASAIAGAGKPFQFPEGAPNAGTNAQTANAANASSPTPEANINDANKTTDAETTNTSLLGRVADMMKGKKSIATLQNEKETAAGLPGQAKTVNDITTQILGLNDQSIALQNAAMAGGQIENQGQQNAEGRGVTAGGLAPLTAAALRKNQIQQAAIAQQSLTAKSAYYAAQGDYTRAKDAADKAAQLEFDAVDQNINYMQALIEQNKPQMTKDEQKRADIVKANLDAQKTQASNAREDFKAGQALAATTLKFNQDNPEALAAAKKVRDLSPQDPEYLNKVMDLVGQYQQDPQAIKDAILERQYKQKQMDYTDAQIKKINADIADSGKASQLDPAQMIAYAQEYASSGKIPTGLPKGTFGMVAELAKGTPKPDGTIINASTGVIPSNINSTQIEGMSAMRDLTKKIGDLQTMYSKTGLLSTATQRQRYTDLRMEVVDLLSRARSGAALTEDEVATYSAKLPSLFSTGLPGSGAPASFGSSFVGGQQLNDLKSSISGKIDTSLAAHGAVMSGYSKVNVGDQKYTVGEIVTNDKGQRGIVNSDGTITEM